MVKIKITEREKMRKQILIVTLVSLILIGCQSQKTDLVKNNFQFAKNQYTSMVQKFDSYSKYPRSINENGQLIKVKPSDWTSGFFPGALWYMYEYTQKDKWKQKAQKFTKNLEDQKLNDGTHDIGFMIFNSFGNGYRLTDNKEYRDIVIKSAKTLSTRFDSTVGCIKSWDWNEDTWEYPVIIDNMMNLEMLFWATEATGDSSFHKIAVSHAKTTIKHHFRDDYSTFHVVDYNPETGKVIQKQTWQGAADTSCWSRGEAWGLYGYTMTYRYTKNDIFLEQAENIAEYILEHPNLPKDMIPYWDFNAPNIPDEPRDASAAAIIASALYELNKYSDNKNYRKYANKILQSLSSEKYRVNNSDFIIDHCVGSKPDNSEVNVPLVYGDYYFLEANLRKMKSE